MRLKHNILANYISQFYVALIGIVMVPMYVRYMGIEAYGLVGFFSMLQAWFQMLDMGLSPTMAREAARSGGGAGNAFILRRLLRSLEVIFIGIAVIGAGVIIYYADAIAVKWLKVQFLTGDEVRHAIMFIAAIVAMRWVSGLYRGAINGFERLVWLGGFNIAVATARFVLVIPVFLYIGTQPTDFFKYQIIVAVVELLVLMMQTYRLMPGTTATKDAFFDWRPLHRVIKFSLSIAFTGSVWVIITQTDKLILSKLLLLTDYAYFNLAILVANGVMIISSPISGALLPRLTRLNAENDHIGLIDLYHKATQMIGVVAIPISLVLALFSRQVIWAWTGDATIANESAPILTLYALGNGILALGAFAYYLQYAKGDLKLHLIGNALFIIILIPFLIVATLHFGSIGAGFAWLGVNIIYFLFWVPRVHRRFYKGLHTAWIRQDLIAIIIMTAAGGLMLKILIVWPQSRMLNAICLGLVSLGMLAIGAAGSSIAREKIIKAWRKTIAGNR